MATGQLTVNDLIDQVRSQIDEENIETIDDVLDILPAMNRAQDYAADIVSRHYEDALLAKTSLDIVAGTQEYSIPEDAFQERIEKVEIEISGTFYDVQRVSYRDISFYETQTTVNIPYYYSVVGNKFRFVPAPTGTFDARIWYMKRPEELVKSQGRITNINTGSNYVIVDSIGSDLTTVVDDLKSYVAVIDNQSGTIKGYFQIQNISNNQITFKTSPDRSTVMNKTIDTSLASPSTGLTIEVDDLLCVLGGNCIPFLKRPLANFLVQYTVAELTRKLGGSADMEERVLQKFEQQVERTWVGREQTLRVKKRNRNWDLPFRRWYHSKF